MLISSLSSLFFHGNKMRTRDVSSAFVNMTKHCYLLGFLIVIIASACLIIDLGQPSRMLSLFLRPSGAVLSWGSFILLATIILGFFLVLANFIYTSVLSSPIKKVAEALCAVSSFLLAAYAGIYLQSVQTVPFWNTFALPILFVFSSLSTGMALIFLVASMTGNVVWLRKRLIQLHVAHRIFLVIELVVLTLLLWFATFDTTATQSLNLLFGSDLRYWFLIGAVGLGIVVPLAAEFYAFLSKKTSLLLPLYVFCLLGSLCLRYCVVAAGVH